MKNVRLVATTLALASMIVGPWATPAVRANNPSWEKLFCKTATSDTMTLMGCAGSGDAVFANAPAFSQVGTLDNLTLVGSPSSPKVSTVEIVVQGVDGKMTVVPMTITSIRQPFASEITSTDCNETTFGAGVMHSLSIVFEDGSGFEMRAPMFKENRSNLSEAVSSAMDLAALQDAEDDVYPPGMKQPIAPVTQPPMPPGVDPSTLVPSNNFIIIYSNNPPTPAMNAAADACWLAYLARCRAAQTTYRTAIGAIGTNDVSDAASGAAIGTVIGGTGGIVVGFLGSCIIGGPIGGGAFVVWGILATVGGGAGALYYAPIGVARGDQAAIDAAEAARKAELDSAWADYLKCLMSAGFQVL